MAFCDNSHKESTQCLKRLPLEHQEQHSYSWVPAIISTGVLIIMFEHLVIIIIITIVIIMINVVIIPEHLI